MEDGIGQQKGEAKMNYSSDTIENLVVEVIHYLQDWGLWNLTMVLACGNSYTSDDNRAGQDEFRGLLYVLVEKGVNPKDYFEYYDAIEDMDDHIFGMTYNSYLEELFNEGIYRAEYGMIAEDIRDFIWDNSNALLKYLDSNEFGYGEELLSAILSAQGDEPKYSMWDPLKYENYEEYEKDNDCIGSGDKDLIPAYTLFDNYEEYKRFLNDGELTMLRDDPVLWDLSKRFAECEIDDDHIIEIEGGKVVSHFKKGLSDIFRKYDLRFDTLNVGWNSELVAFPIDETYFLRYKEQKKEAVERLKLLGASEAEIEEFEENDAIPCVKQYSDGSTTREYCVKPSSKAGSYVFKNNLPYYMFSTGGAIPMDAYLYVQENPDENEMYRKELTSEEGDLAVSAIVFTDWGNEYEFGAIGVKVTENGPVRVE